MVVVSLASVLFVSICVRLVLTPTSLNEENHTYTNVHLVVKALKCNLLHMIEAEMYAIYSVL